MTALVVLRALNCYVGDPVLEPMYIQNSLTVDVKLPAIDDVVKFSGDAPKTTRVGQAMGPPHVPNFERLWDIFSFYCWIFFWLLSTRAVRTECRRHKIVWLERCNLNLRCGFWSLIDYTFFTGPKTDKNGIPTKKLCSFSDGLQHNLTAINERSQLLVRRKS